MTENHHDNDHTHDAHTPDLGHDHTVSSAGAGTPTPGTQPIPETIGDYRIIGVLGEGGMGVVYEAEQPSPRRRVALKVVRGVEVVDDLRLKMFQREAETLARLDHPNIGAIYSSGRTNEGRHYFAMELVRGNTLADWLDSRPRRPDADEIKLRLQLFRQICDAVQYAHQRGVIHRDLKPSNLIVTESSHSGVGSVSSSGSSIMSGPMVKILDFGLARITEEDVAMTQITEIGVIKGTLPYMAPEQASGQVDAIDVRTDVYALGVILYELLTGKRPYSTDTGSLIAAVRVICEQEPEAMSQHWNSTTKLDPDLITITMKSLEKDPDQRYGSAAAFGEDIGRFLTSQPILARPASTMYQLKKLVSRRKALFTTMAASVVLLIVAAVGIGVLYVRSEANLTRALEAEQAAVVEAETAQRTSDFLVDLFRRANPENTRGETVTAREVMDEGARSVREELSDEPAIQTRFMSTLAEVYMSLGMYGDARSLVEESMAIRREHLPEGDEAHAISQHQLARVTDYQGDLKAAKQEFAKAVAQYEEIGEEGHDGLARVLGNMSWTLSNLGEYDEAFAAVNRAIELVENAEAPDDDRLMKLLSNKAAYFTSLDKLDSSLATSRQAMDIVRRNHGENHVQMAHLKLNMSTTFSRAGDYEAATKEALAALEIYRSYHGDDHPDVAQALGNVGICYAQQRELDKARPYMEEVIATLKQVHGADHPQIARGYTNLGLLKVQLAEYDNAIADLKTAVSMLEKTGSTETPGMSVALYHLASAEGLKGNLSESRSLMQRVIAIDEGLYGAESPQVADDLDGLIMVERFMGLDDEADKNQARMQAILDKLKSGGSGL